MILYHGSNQEITEIDLTKTRPNKDFGQGFYLTEDKEQDIQRIYRRMGKVHLSQPQPGKQSKDTRLWHRDRSHRRRQGGSAVIPIYETIHRPAYLSEELAVRKTDYPVLFRNGTCHQIIKEAMTDDEQFMIECITTELTNYVMRDYHIGMQEALDRIYNSET